MIIPVLHGACSSSTKRGIYLQNLEVHYSTFNSDSYYKGKGATIDDLTANNLDGTISGAPTFSLNYFTGLSNDYIITPNLSPTVGESHSVEVWIYPTNNGVVTQYNAQATPNTSYHHSGIEIVSGNLEFGLWNGTDITSTGATSAIQFNTWSQVVLTYDGTTVRGYLNGSEVGSVNVSWDSPIDDNNTLYISFGSLTDTDQGDGTYFDGQFGIMRVYSTALTASQIARNYNSATGNIGTVKHSIGFYIDPSNPASYSGSGTTVGIVTFQTLNSTMTNVTFNDPYFSFSGSNSYIRTPDNAILEDGSYGLSVEAWVRFNNFNQSQVIVGKFDNGGTASDVSYALRANTSGEVRFEVGDGTGSTSSNTFSASTNTWYQVVGVFDKGNSLLYLYINGVSQGSVACTYSDLLDSANDLYIGEYNGGEYSQGLNGDIGIVRIYTEDMTSEEVSGNYLNDYRKYL